MFRKISLKLALQFTAFVTLLVLINGATFIAADFRVTQRMTDGRLLQDAHHLLDLLQPTLDGAKIQIQLSPRLRDRVRIVDTEGNTLVTGNMFANITFDPQMLGFTSTTVQGEDFRFVTVPITHGDEVVGFLQLGNSTDLRAGDLPQRAAIFLFTALAISILTFLVGLFFAKKALKPVEETMQRLEQFTQDASHELRTPLAVLGSSLDVALKTKKYKEGIDSAKEDLGQISVLVERLLELARLDTFALEAKPVDLSQMTTETAEKFTPLAKEKGVGVTATVASGIRTQADDALLRQVMGNLLSNAIKFTPGGGTITVRLTKKILSISDTGIGISKENLPHIFDRFFQAESSRSYGGLGLGLALVKRIVDLHGWTIEAESEQGKGTTFIIRFTAL